MIHPTKKPVSNWGNYPEIIAKEYTPQTIEEIQEVLAQEPTIIARGNGRCYGDASLQDTLLSTKRLNYFIDFDRDNGIIECESGVLLSEIIEVIIPEGFFIAVTPGTKFITVGGAIASDVHGKNHHVDGCFSEHVLYFDLMIENGEVLRCSREENAAYFWATIGGMGLTGIILSARFQLKKIETAYIQQEAIQAQNLDEMYQLIDESESWTYTVAWIDCLQKGKNLGKGLLLRGEHAVRKQLSGKLYEQPLTVKKKFHLNIPFNFPSFVLNPWSIKIFNFLYYHKQLKKKSGQIIDIDSFFYPLDAVFHWNRIYGKKGFIQYQFVIPKENGKEGMRKILETIAQSGNGSFLVVLKLFGLNNPQAYNSFPFPGYTLALDFKLNKNLPQLVKRLDALVKQYDGRIYRTKDAMSDIVLTDYLQNTESSKFDSLQNQRIHLFKNK
ncbi:MULTISPECIES: FAD-binding oxidoreductase [Weeksella]|uniref:FAD-binding oxidoreductase n=1 Tax=Weeksella TaxID=1013 RepID=UPI0008A5455D|nr:MULTISPECIES: FAD-binding oxidoreductase [Weeksella]MDK7374447.1 FAD-binding oxidoreductase [Weeksella virosa]OFM81835.1 FAD-linked oxidase [Weeksella sp. HMSC059D05]